MGPRRALQAFEDELPGRMRRLQLAEMRCTLDPTATAEPERERFDDFVLSGLRSIDFSGIHSAPPSATTQRWRMAWRLLVNSRMRTDGNVGPMAALMERRIREHVALVDGRELALPRVLELMSRTRGVKERKRLWASYFRRDVAQETDFLRLRTLRNRAARQLGFRDYFHLSLAMGDVSRSGYGLAIRLVKERLSSDLRSRADGREARRKRRRRTPWGGDPDGIGGDRPDEFALLPARSLVPRVRRALQAIGLPIAQGVRISTTDLPIGGVTFLIRTPGDFRVVVSRVGGVGGYMRLVHELAHAHHFGSIEQDGQLLKDETGSILVEAYAALESRVFASAEFYCAHLGLDHASGSHLAEGYREESLSTIRMCLALGEFERGLYEGAPGGGRRAYSSAMSALGCYDEVSGHEWYWDPMAVGYPCYQYSYGFAELLAMDMARHFERVQGGYFPGRIRSALERSMYRTGAGIPWGQKVLNLLGGSDRNGVWSLLVG